MFNFFKRKKEREYLKKHIAGATVSHNSPFDNLTIPYQIDKLSQEFYDKWVSPFYFERLWEGDNFGDKFLLVEKEIKRNIVEQMLGYFDWRSRISGAYFAALKDFKDLEEIIGTLFLKSEVCYAGEGYILALTHFNTERSIGYLKKYLDYYLQKTDLWFDQGDAMAAMIWLDKENNTSLVKDNNYLDKWHEFISNKPNWNLEHYNDFFGRRMNKIIDIKKVMKNSM